MEIGRIDGLNPWNDIAVSRVGRVGADEIRQQPEKQLEKQADVSAVPSREESAAPARPGKGAAPEDISLTFNRKESFSYIGRDSDIEGLDLQKAISDMQKDQILQQYNYFVGSAKSLMTDNMDRIVIREG